MRSDIQKGLALVCFSSGSTFDATCFENIFRLKALEPQFLKQTRSVLTPASPKQPKFTVVILQPGTRLQVSHCSSCYTVHGLRNVLALPLSSEEICMQEESTHPGQGMGAHGPHLTAGISTLSWCLRCPVAQHCAAQTTPGKEPTLIISIP